MCSNIHNKSNAEFIKKLDNNLSNRSIELDPKGYFLIRIDPSKKELILEHFSNDIDDIGQAIDPITREPIGCKGSKRKPFAVYRGRSAKELGIKITEAGYPYPISKIDHALYLGRELQKAEQCLISGKPYFQD